MKLSQVYDKINKRADPNVVGVIMNMASDLHTLKQQHAVFMQQFAQLAEIVKVLMQQSQMYHTAIDQLVRKVGGDIKSNEEFASEVVDTDTDRFN